MSEPSDIESELAWKLGPDFVKWKVSNFVQDNWPILAASIAALGLLFFVLKKKGKK